MKNVAAKPNFLILCIMVAVLVWGGYLAIGAFHVKANHANLRGLIVFGCTVGFLALWLGALAARRRRIEREAEESADTNPKR